MGVIACNAPRREIGGLIVPSPWWTLKRNCVSPQITGVCGRLSEVHSPLGLAREPRRLAPGEQAFAAAVVERISQDGLSQVPQRFASPALPQAAAATNLLEPLRRCAAQDRNSHEAESIAGSGVRADSAIGHRAVSGVTRHFDRAFVKAPAGTGKMFHRFSDDFFEALFGFN